MSPPAQRYPAHANPVRRLGRAGSGCTLIPDQLVRHGVAEFGANAFCVLAYLLSHSNGWETSCKQMSAQLGWGPNRQRCSAALRELEKCQRLVIRDHIYEDGARVRQEYVVHADGRRFTDVERQDWSRPIVLSRKSGGDTPPC